MSDNGEYKENGTGDDGFFSGDAGGCGGGIDDDRNSESQALVVFVLYVQCTTINPADPGIMSKFERGAKRGDMGHDLHARDISRKFNEMGRQLQSSPSAASRISTLAANSSVKGSLGDAPRVEDTSTKSFYFIN